MLSGVHVKAKSGQGMSGHIERNKSNFTDRHGYVAYGGADVQRGREPPATQRSKRETPEAKVKLSEHLALRAIKVECEELREKLSLLTKEDAEEVVVEAERTAAGHHSPPSPSSTSLLYTSAEVDAQVKVLFRQRYTQLKEAQTKQKKRMAEEALERRQQKAAAAAAQLDGGVAEEGVFSVKADRFASAILGNKQPKDGAVGDGEGAFDIDAKKAARAEKRVGRWKRQSDSAEEKVVAKLLGEQEEQQARRAESSRPTKKRRLEEA